MSTVGKVITCKAAVTWEKGTKSVIEDIEVDPPKANEVRVKIVCSGVCHSDMSSDEGVLKVNYPIINGHEGAGVVESIGEGVTSVQIGDHVLTTFVPNCKACRICTKIHDKNLCLLGPKLLLTGRAIDGTHRYQCRDKPIFNFVGISSFSEFAVIHESSITKINKSTPLDKACLLSCGVATGYGAALRTAKVPSGSTCAVWGLGTIGLATVMGCKAAGAEKIYGIDINPAKEEFGRLFGMTDFINPKDHEKPVSNVLAELTAGGVDFAFDCVGHKTVIDIAFASVHPSCGTCVIVGVPHHETQVTYSPAEVMFGKSIIGTLYGGYKARDDIPKLVEKYSEKKLQLDEFVTKKLPLTGLQEAYQMMREGKGLRTVLDIGKI